jgi:hypothetical protein
MRQHKLDRLCPQAKPTLQLEAIFGEPGQIPIPVGIYFVINFERSNLKLTIHPL